MSYFYVSLVTRKKNNTLNSLNSTAILLFANSAKEELTHKYIYKGEQLFDTLTQTTLLKANNTALPVFHFNENDQVGFTFGERFTNAIVTVFEKGFDNIITIGNDTPQLQTQHLKNAAQQLALGNTVVGPSIDGGIYLLGLRKIDFDVATFKSFPWQHNSLVGCISNWLQGEATEVVKLPVFHDLDDEKDLKSILSHARSLSSLLIKLIISILTVQNATYQKIIEFSDLFQNRSMYNKGSPQISLA